MQLLPAIIFINNDINDTMTATLVNQLYISETITGEEFDARVIVDPNYPTIIHLMRLRILVIRDDFNEYTNRDLADIVMFLSHGMASILENNYGPPGLTLPISKLNLNQLILNIDA